MLKKYLVIFYVLVMVRVVRSDQLAWITLDQAKQTVEYFEDNDIKQVVLWCACCENDVKTKVSVTNVFYRQVKESPAYYEFVIVGTYLGGEKLSDAFDLAYVHILRGSKWRCLGKELKFECDPCTKSFKY